VQKYNKKSIFNMAYVRHIGFVLTSTYCIRDLNFSTLNLMSIIKLDMHDYVPEIYTGAYFHFNPFSGGCSPDRRIITVLWLFLLYSTVFFSRHAPRLNPWAAQPGGVGDNAPTLGTSRVQGVQGRSNENDLCFYSRQSLSSTVQVTEFQLPW